MCVELQYSLHDINALVESEIKPRLHKVRIILFYGTLGAGKTTLIKKIVAALGSDEVVTSSTFNYVNVYQGHDLAIQHFDLYRLTSRRDFEELGLHEKIGIEGTISLIEWPSIIEEFFMGEAIQYKVMCVRLSYNLKDHGVRRMSLALHG